MTIKPKIKQQAAFPMIAEAMLRGALTAKLAKDAELDLKPILTVIGNGKTKLDLDKIMIAVDSALKPVNGKPKLAMDADVADVREVLEQLSDMAPDIANMVVGGPDAPINVEAGGGVPPGGEPDAFGKQDGSEKKDGSEVPPGNPDAPIDKEDNASPDDVPIENASKNESDESDGDPAESEPDDNAGETDGPMAKVMQFLDGKLSPEDLAQLKQIMEGDMATDSNKGTPPVGVTKAAMDAAIATAKIETEIATIARMNGVSAAIEAVRPWIAIKTAMDSAESVYKLALDKIGVKNLDKIHPSAYPALLAAQPLPGKGIVSPKRPTANDTEIKDYSDRYNEFDKRLKA